MFVTLFRRFGGRLIYTVCALLLVSCATPAGRPTLSTTPLPGSTSTLPASRTPRPDSTSTPVPSNPRRPSLALTPGTSTGRLGLVEELRKGGYVMYMLTTEGAENHDHAQADRNHCPDSSHLSDQGRFDARSTGASFLALGIPAGQVLHSGACSAREMALLVFGREQPWVDVNGGPDLLRGERIALLRSLLSTAPRPGTNTVLVGPGPELTDVTGNRYAEGETLIFKPLGKTGFSFFARILLPGWEQLEGSATDLAPVQACAPENEQPDQAGGQFEICRPVQPAALPGEGLLLPDLVPLAPTDLRIRVNGSNGHKILRLTNSITNLGPGKMELWGDKDRETGKVSVSQYLYRDDDSTETTPVGEFFFHPEHDHWHFGGFARYDILSFSPAGAFDTVVASSDKVSYCLRDDARAEFVPDASRWQSYTNCDLDRQGISVGWTDVYRYYLPGQTIDINLLPDGIYALQTIVDPENRLREGNRSNNTNVLYIEITGMQVKTLKAPDVFDQLPKVPEP